MPPETGCPAAGVVDVGFTVGAVDVGAEVAVVEGFTVGCVVDGAGPVVVVVDFSPQPLKIIMPINIIDKETNNIFFIFSP
jgi:hypothetical protein